MKKNAISIEDRFLLDQKIFYDKNNKKYIPFSYISFLIIFLLLILNLYITIKFVNNQKNQDIIYKYKSNYDYIKFNNIETKDLNILKLIENEIKNTAQLIPEQQKFLHGLIRTIKPKKIVEIGVARGGSSVLILNAIKDIKGAKLYSIDKSIYCYLERNKKSGYLVQEKFPELMNQWTLYTGGITSEFIETIGDGIDLVFIDTMHATPGEMLDWLMVLPFLKKGAIVIFHDLFSLYGNRNITKKKKLNPNSQLICYIRGELILPHYGNKVFFRNIGGLKLAQDQQKNYYAYFLALGIQWEYMPSDGELKLMRNFFMKYYGEKYVEVFDDAVEKNKIYLKNHKK
jgi:predicted O-methyltransferase YrrM